MMCDLQLLKRDKIRESMKVSSLNERNLSPNMIQTPLSKSEKVKRVQPVISHLQQAEVKDWQHKIQMIPEIAGGQEAQITAPSIDELAKTLIALIQHNVAGKTSGAWITPDNVNCPVVSILGLISPIQRYMMYVLVSITGCTSTCCISDLPT